MKTTLLGRPTFPPRPFLLPEFPGLRSAIVTMRANDTLLPLSSLSPPPLRCRYQKRYNTALNRATHRKSAHTLDAIRPQTNVTGRVNRSQDCEIGEIESGGGEDAIDGWIEDRSGDEWFSRKSAQDILLFVSF